MNEKDLQNFIYFFMHNKELTREQQKKRDVLFARDLGNNRIVVDKGNKDAGRPSIKELSALETATFLSKFNDPKGLKYLTHDFDNNNDGSPETIAQLLTQIQGILDSKKFNIPQSLFALLYGFVKGGKWNDTYGGNHQSCFSCQEWSKWSLENNLHPINNSEYKKEIMAFRSTVRLIPKALSEICNKASEGLSLEIESEKLDSADFYTNTFCLYSSIKRILSMMDNRAKDYPNVRISFQRANDSEGRLLRKIVLTQKGSFDSKPFDDVKKRLENHDDAGDFGAIRKILNGYCLWSVENIWDGKPYRWNILKTSGQKDVDEEIEKEEIIGFTHTLTFYIV